MNTDLRSMLAAALPSPAVLQLPVAQRVKGGPEWASSDKFDIEAKAEDASAPTAQLLSMLRQLLTQSFQLEVHTETKQVKGFELRVAQSGPKLKAGAGDFEGVHATVFRISATNASMTAFADSLSGTVRAPVVDRTGLKGGYEFTLPVPAPFSIEGPSIIAVLRKELGLQLQPAKVPVEIVVIDHAEKPTED
jgi:uncharacterized protein (TIGR03435 family)